MAVIGFFNYQDFLEEIKDAVLWGQPVRVQAYNVSRGDKSGVLKYYTFIVEVAVQVIIGGADVVDVLVCRFITAKTQAMTGVDGHRLEKLDKRNRRAAGIMRRRLEADGYRVRKGLVAATKDSDIESDPVDVWTAADLNVEDSDDA